MAIIYETISIVSEKIDKIICDSCGIEIENEYGGSYMLLEANWGYQTNHDLEKWSVQICEKCVEEKLQFINFKKE